MRIQTFTFPHIGGIIPNVPNPDSANGEFHAGQEVDVDLDTMTVVSTRLINAPVELAVDEQPTQELASIEAKPSKKSAKEAKD